MGEYLQVWEKIMEFVVFSSAQFFFKPCEVGVSRRHRQTDKVICCTQKSKISVLNTKKTKYDIKKCPKKGATYFKLKLDKKKAIDVLQKP